MDLLPHDSIGVLHVNVRRLEPPSSFSGPSFLLMLCGFGMIGMAFYAKKKLAQRSA